MALDIYHGPVDPLSSGIRAKIYVVEEIRSSQSARNERVKSRGMGSHGHCGSIQFCIRVNPQVAISFMLSAGWSGSKGELGVRDRSENNGSTAP